MQELNASSTANWGYGQFGDATAGKPPRYSGHARSCSGYACPSARSSACSCAGYSGSGGGSDASSTACGCCSRSDCSCSSSASRSEAFDGSEWNDHSGNDHAAVEC